MNHPSTRVLYAKYNSTRKPEYRVTTEILEEGDRKIVRKRAGGEEAKSHLESIFRNCGSLKDYYRDIRVIEARQEGESIVFPYITGSTLAEQIDARKLSKDEFVSLVNRQMDKVLSVREEYVHPFERTAEFEAVFGKADPGNIPALNPANVDSVLSNFIENESGIHCIDYEWVFHFPVPAAFIRYRILLYLYVTQVHAQMKDVSMEEMLGWFGFSKGEQKMYWQMDDRFQQYVHGVERKYIYLDRYKKDNLQIEQIRQKMQDQEALIQNQGARIRQLTEEVQKPSGSVLWGLRKTVRKFKGWLKFTIKKHEGLYLFLRSGKDTILHGREFARENREQYFKSKESLRNANAWPSEQEKEEQRRTRFPREITFSILVPLYNTPENFLRRMIESVQDQTYGNWELCLADGSDGNHGDVESICLEYARKDARIRYRRIEENLGISGNTNVALELASGDYIVLFDHDDVLHPSALFENMKVICEEDADFLYSDESTFHNDPSDAYWSHFKPDFSPDTLRGYNYICHLTVFKKSLMDEAGGGFRSRFDGSQDYDMVLRLTEKASHIVHIPKVLYFWRSHSASVASDVSAKPYTIDSGKAALAEHLQRLGLKGTVEDSGFPSTYKIQYAIEGKPLVSIVIPNMDHVEDLKKCIDSITEKTTWINWEIVVVENNSQNEDTFAYYRTIEKRPMIRVVTWKGNFNFSAICNYGAQEAKGEYILLLNNDTEVISPDWLEQMLMFAQRKDVGAAGAMLYYPDGTIQHAGLIMGIQGTAGHSHKGFPRGDYGYLLRLTVAQNLSGVTGACLMVRREVWEEFNGLDESFAVAYNDVDFCLRLREAGYLIVWTPYAELFHYESKSRGYEDTPEKQERFEKEKAHLLKRWGDVIKAGDPYYNPNLTLDREDFSFR